MDGLFEVEQAPEERFLDAPLAARLRPRSLDELIGHDHIKVAGSPIRQLLEDQRPLSVVLWGPPGTGKTTIASLVSEVTGWRLVELSAVSAGIKNVREAISGAREYGARGQGTVLFVDEVHRFNKTQQDVLLPAVEAGWVTLIAATTENPSFSIVSPLLSRSLLVRLPALTDDDLSKVVQRALREERGLPGRTVSPEALDHIVRLAGGDARRALTYLEAAAGVAGAGEITLAMAEQAADQAAVRYDRQGDQHYDVISAFIKSIRGSDADAAMHYLARMIEAGEDPRFIARRLIISASEDVGLAEPEALRTAVAAAQAVSFIGMPEGRIPLAQATLALALAPKSNAAIVAIDEALADVRAGKMGPIPAHLRDAHYPGAATLGNGVGYRYPHDEEFGVSAQQYAPEEIGDTAYFRPRGLGAEAAVRERWERIKQLIRAR